VEFDSRSDEKLTLSDTVAEFSHGLWRSGYVLLQSLKAKAENSLPEAGELSVGA
jgi:hypothetical protein